MLNATHSVPRFAATHLRLAERGFLFDMPSGEVQFFSAAAVVAAPWFDELPADDREHIEDWIERWARSDARREAQQTTSCVL